jgi:putative ABC transport system substrate-binding protein
MRRRDFLGAVGGAAALPLSVRAQQSAMPVIGYLTENSFSPHINAAFQQGLAELGYEEGKNFATEYRRKPRSMPGAAADLVSRNVNVIFAPNPGALSAAIKATTSIPVIGIDLESDPVAKGYVQSIARPGGNITGMFLDIPQLCGKHLGLLKEIVPGLSRIAILGIPQHNAPQFAATETAARAAGVETERLEVRAADDLPGALEEARVRSVEAGILLSSPLIWQYSKPIAELALANRLPLISLFAEFPKNGGFIGYGPNLEDIYRRCGQYVAKVLHGTKASELPLQRPETFNLIINLKTAKEIGLVVPPTFLAGADEVIE